MGCLYFSVRSEAIPKRVYLKLLKMGEKTGLLTYLKVQGVIGRIVEFRSSGGITVSSAEKNVQGWCVNSLRKKLS